MDEMKDAMLTALKVLNARELQVIVMRFGLMDGRRYTLAEIGNAFGVTRERVRQLEARAMKKLRAATGQGED